MPLPASRDVFINCPFDAAYKPLFQAIVFTVIRSGYEPRCALEVDDASVNRFAKIASIIEQCAFGIHDISRTEAEGDPPLPRFNMPLELGLFLGAKRYGKPAQRKKACIVFDIEPYRFQRFMSDIAGQDIHAHGGRPDRLIEALAGWLRRQGHDSRVPGGRQIAADYQEFRRLLPTFCDARRLHPDELTFGDDTTLMSEYVAKL